MTALFAVMMGVGGLVTRGNVGLRQRGNALASIPWLGIVAYALRSGRRSDRPGSRATARPRS